MNLSVNRKDLIATLDKVKHAANKRSTLPITTYVKLEAGNGRLTLMSNDLEMALVASCDAQVDKPGMICVLPKELETFLKAIKIEAVSMAVEEEKGHPWPRLKVEGGATYCKLETMKADDFPQLAELPKGKPIVIPNLAACLNAVSYAMAVEDTRPVLMGVVFRQDEGKKLITMAAADGFRLTITSCQPENGRLHSEIIVPGHAIRMVEKLMKGKTVAMSYEAEPVYIVTFKTDDLLLISRLVLGTFPNWKQLIPKAGTTLTVAKSDLEEALRLMAATMSDSKIIRFHAGSNGTMDVSTINEGAETKTTIPCAKSKRKAVKIAFNHGYLMDMVKRAGDMISFDVTTPSSPAKILQNETTHVLMPMFVKW